MRVELKYSWGYINIDIGIKSIWYRYKQTDKEHPERLND